MIASPTIPLTNKPRAMRGPGDSYSDVIPRLVEIEAQES
jgi:hypothetical protein